jgi:hypothetical protein
MVLAALAAFRGTAFGLHISNLTVNRIEVDNFWTGNGRDDVS